MNSVRTAFVQSALRYVKLTDLFPFPVRCTQALTLRKCIADLELAF